LVVEPHPHLIHSGGQVTVDGDLDNVQHERDSAWGERNSTLAHLRVGENRFIVITGNSALFRPIPLCGVALLQ
jgi:hypothetical protein